MTLLYILYPAVLLSAACVGYGLTAMAVLGARFAGVPIAFRVTAAYFLGQGLLAAIFVSLALFGVFSYPCVVGFIVLGAILCPIVLWLHRHDIRSASAEAWTSWLRAPLSWRFLAIMAAVLFLGGVFTMGRILEVDATAFYLAAAKLIVQTGRIGTLPGYENFSWVIMTGEFLYASLMLLGSPSSGARFFEWINFFPVLVALYWVVRFCDLPVRAAFLAAVMGLTTSAGVGLLGGSKTDTFAIGPALIATSFALASWRPDHRRAFIAASGLFCGLAIAAKATYIIVLLPSTMLLIYWHDICAALGEAKALAWRELLRRATRIAGSSLLFLIFVALGLAPFVIKNLILFHAPFGHGAGLASSAFFSRQTTLRLVLSYPFALTYGRYWGQLGTLSPLILAFIPLFFLMPRNERKLATAVTAMMISTVIALAIWIALMPSIFMPRYTLATLLLFCVPAAAGAAYLSRRRTVLAGIIVLATAIVTMLTPNLLHSRYPVYHPEEALDYFRLGNEAKLFVRDPYFATTMEVNNSARPNDRVLLLAYPRLWLRGDLLAATSTSVEMEEAGVLLNQASESFWTYLREKKFSFLVLEMAKLGSMDALEKVKPAGLEFCEIIRYGGVVAFQIGEGCVACPSGDRTILNGPFPKLWADGNAFKADIPALEMVADSSAVPAQSSLALCEGDKRLRPSHSLHTEIRTLGSGRFSHWDKELYFSTSDNSDPNTNGRTYSLVRPQ